MQKYYPPEDIQEMAESISPEEYQPNRIIEEFIEEQDGENITKYVVEGQYLGTYDLEDWTRDEFDKPETKYLLEEWEKWKLQEEKEKKYVTEIYKSPTNPTQRIKEILEFELDEDKKAKFKCVTAKGNTEWLKDDQINGKRKVNEYMKLQGYSRAREDPYTWKTF